MKELSVHYEGRGENYQLGTLATDGPHTLFEYTPEAIERQQELSPIRLKLRTQAYPNDPGEYRHLRDLPGLLYDALPDGWGLLLMDRRLKQSGVEPHQLSSLDRLAYLGERTMGALTFKPSAGVEEANDLTLLELAREVQAIQTDADHKVLAALARAGGSPGGARPKVLVHFNPATGFMSTHEHKVPGAEPWLVKFPAKDDEPDSCALEAAYAMMANACELGMMPTQFFPLAKGKTAFGTQRFDRSNGQRIHIHSLAGLLHLNYSLPQLDYAGFLRTTWILTKDVRETLKALRRCIFNVLMNNRDDHTKNFAFMLDEQGAWRLAPPFDLTYCAGPMGEHFMAVGSSARQPKRADIIAVAKGGGLSAKQAEQELDWMLAKLPMGLFPQVAAQLPIRPAQVDLVNQAIEANRRRLLAA